MYKQRICPFDHGDSNARGIQSMDETLIAPHVAVLVATSLSLFVTSLEGLFAHA